MTLVRRVRALLWGGTVAAAGLAAVGCATGEVVRVPPVHDLPRELDKVSLPPYRVEPPDVLLIEAVKAVPKPPFKIEPLDVLLVHLANPIKDEPLSGLFTVDPDGTINLGPAYKGSVRVVGLTIPEAKDAVEVHLKKTLNDPQVTVSLAQSRAAQRITGTHLVRQDGTVSLGTYGSVRVVGLTLPEVRAAVEAQLSKYLLNPEVLVEVQGFNSKTYYVIMDGGGAGQQVVRLPITGNETVLDAIANVNGLSPVSSTHHIWVARPAPRDCGAPSQILPVDWFSVSTRGDPTTNYQLMPGDRVYVDAQAAVVVDTYLARFLAPIERLFGVTLLGASAVNEVQGRGLNSNGR
jgi:polysaccharide export outer membrane protein